MRKPAVRDAKRLLGANTIGEEHLSVKGKTGRKPADWRPFRLSFKRGSLNSDMSLFLADPPWRPQEVASEPAGRTKSIRWLKIHKSVDLGCLEALLNRTSAPVGSICRDWRLDWMIRHVNEDLKIDFLGFE